MKEGEGQYEFCSTSIGRNGVNLKQFLIQTGVTFVAAGLGAIFGAFLTRQTERFKHLQELRSAAYVDFLRGFGKVANAQRDTVKEERSFLEEREGSVIVADAKARIGVYGSKTVLHALAVFISRGSQTQTAEGMRALTDVCKVMRNEASEDAPFDDIHTMLFGR